jgi:hypothetical protein
MISEGQIVLFKFLQTDQKEGKLRPAFVLRELLKFYLFIFYLYYNNGAAQFKR